MILLAEEYLMTRVENFEDEFIQQFGRAIVSLDTPSSTVKKLKTEPFSTFDLMEIFVITFSGKIFPIEISPFVTIAI